MTRHKLSFLLGLFSLSLISPQIANAVPSPAGDLEVLQTMATIQFNSGQNDKALAGIKKILAIDSANADALELRALIERKLKNDDQAAKTYEELLTKGPKAKRPAYHFELATILFKQKKNKEAKSHFQSSVLGFFNSGASHFFLGVIDFNNHSWRDARSHFANSLTYEDGKPMAQISRFYLASSYIQIGKTDAALYNFRTAAAGDVGAKAESGVSSLTKEIQANSDKEFNNADKGGKFISVSMLTQWDGNVQTNPSEVINPIVSNGEKSLKTILTGTVGYMTSPTGVLQLIPSYQFYTNYNYNYLARDFNFITHTGSLYALFRPFTKFIIGGKGKITYSMKNDILADEDRSRMKYRSYSLISDFGPVMKYELTPRFLLSGEVLYRPKKYFNDPSTGDSRRTGGGLYAKAGIDWLSPLTWWSPTVYGSYEFDHPVGKTYRMYAIGGGVSNTLSLSEKLNVTGLVEIIRTDYTDTRTPKRDDTYMNFDASAAYTLNSHWSLSGDLGYTRNDSSDPTNYKYNRLVVSTGATYAF